MAVDPELKKEYYAARATERKLTPQEVRQRVDVLRVFQMAHQCKRCGKCCIESDPIGIVGVEVIRIAKYLKMKPADFRDKYLEGRLDHWHLLKKEVGKPCPFLTGKEGEATGCKIYPVRPEVCRVFPWLSHITIAESNLPDVALATNCPQMELTFNVVKKYVNEKIKGGGL